MTIRFKGIIVLLSLITSLSGHAYCDRSSYNDMQRSECRLETRLRFSEIKDNQYSYLRNLTNVSSKLLFKGKVPGLPAELEENIWTPHVRKALTSFINDSTEGIKDITVDDQFSLYEKIGIKNKLLKYIHDPRLRNEEKEMIILGVHKVLDEMMIQDHNGRWKLDEQMLNQLGSLEFKVEDLKKALGDIDIDKADLENKISENISKMIEENILSKIDKSPAIVNLKERLQKLEEERASGANNQEEIDKAKAELANKRSEIVAEFDHEEFDKALTELGHANTILATLISFEDPQLGRKISTISNAVVSIGKNVNAIAEAGAAGASLGPYAAVAVAAFSIYQALQDPGPTPEQIILEQIAKLSKQIDDFRLEMHERFDQIQSILGEMYTGIMNQLFDMHKDLRDVSAGVDNIEQTLKTIKRELKRIDNLIYTYTLEGVNKPYLAFRERCLTWNELHYVEIPDDKLLDCVSAFFDWSTELSSLTVLTGKTIPTDDSYLYFQHISETTENRPYEYLVNLYSGLTNEYTSLVNPLAWSSGAYSFMTMRRQHPEKGNVMKQMAVEKMMEKGQEVIKFANHLHKTKLPTKYLESALKKKSYILDKMIAKKNQFLNKEQKNPLIKSVEASLKSFEDLGPYHQSDSFNETAIFDRHVKSFKDDIKRLKELEITDEYSSLFDEEQSDSKYIAQNLIVSPCKKYEWKLSANGTTWHKPWKIVDQLVLTGDDLKQLIPETYRKAVAVGEGELKACYLVNARSVKKPINGTIACPHCGPGTWLNHRLSKFTLKISYISKSQNLDAVIVKKEAKYSNINLLYGSYQKIWKLVTNWENRIKTDILKAKNPSETNMKYHLKVANQDIEHALNKLVPEMQSFMNLEVQLNDLLELDAKTQLTRGLLYYGANETYNDNIDVRYTLSSGDVLMDASQYQVWIHEMYTNPRSFLTLGKKKEEEKEKADKAKALLEKVFKKDKAEDFALVTETLEEMSEFIDFYYDNRD